MKKFNQIVCLLLLCTLAFACTQDFEETNTDPNRLSQITAGSPLNPVIYEMATRNGIQVRNVGAPLMQMFIRSDDYINTPFMYDFVQDIGGSTWNTYYLQLNNLKEMEEAAIRDEMINYEAIALTLKAYAFSILTDSFGDVPMEEALQAEENTWYPKFTSQEEIYTRLLENLEYANSLYDEESPMPYVADVLYENDITKWQKFTNSLRIRLLLRISNQQTSALNEITNILSNPTEHPIFTSREDEAVLHLSDAVLSPWDRPQDFGTFRAYSQFFIDNLNNFEDPRRPVFAGTARGLEGENYGYIGQPIDYMNEPLPDSIANASGVRNTLAEAPLIIPFLSYAEIEFIKAEMAQRGFISNAEEHYQNGVQAAIEMWDIEMPENYFENSFTEYDGSLERIMLQKYYALFFTDYQAWFEHRRTGLPELPTSSAMSNNQEMPKRFYYPLDEADRNSQNYQEAVNRIGGDEINIPVWWDNN